MNLKNLKISIRLSAAFGLLTALLMAVVAMALVQMGTMSAASSEITDNWLPSVEKINTINAGGADFRILEFRHVMNTDDKAMAAIDAEMAKVLTAFEDTRQAYVKLISSDEERRMYEQFTADWKQYMQVHEQILVHSRKNENTEAAALLQGPSQKFYTSSMGTLDKLIDLNHKGAMAESQVSAKAYVSARNIMFVTAAAALLLSIGMAIWLIRSITRPLNKAVAAADRVASGDLTGRIEADSSDETGQLLSALQRMQQSLTDTISGVRSNADGVAAASSQIAQGNADLSQRTEEQASSLEETASSMEELTSTVKQNADNARQANQLAAGASSVAVKGGAVVGQVVETMSSINDSSRKIVDIISVIDGIAFQTNILALNAAVEAARAGEQGRGFAVVASEVRSLAQRSAAAAKEIKGLITDSVGKVEDGTRLVGEAGKTMDEIVNSVKRVTDIMAEIAAASQEQSSGIEQVNQAITQMDEVTQQNAALVEESSAAAESLKGQAQQLVHTVAVFKLTQGIAAANNIAQVEVAAPPRRTATITAIKRRKPAEIRQPVKAEPVTQTRKVANAKSGEAEWQEF